MKITEKDYIKAMKKASRELEIELFGKQITTKRSKIHKSKKLYSRKLKHKKNGETLQSL